MKKKRIFYFVVLCVVAVTVVLAAKASASECKFQDASGDYYVCLLTDRICESGPVDCHGIKYLLLPARPQHPDPNL